MAIREYLEQRSSFDPDAVTVMSQAFVDVCADLQVFADDKRGRDAIATRIIDLASSGLLDSKALREQVLQEAKSAALLASSVRSDGGPFGQRVPRTA